jgi:hypothetical protein
VTPRRRRALIVGAAIGLLAVVPAAVTVARSDEFSASFEVIPLEHRLFELPGGSLGYVRLLLRDPALGRRTVALSGLAMDDTSVRRRIELRSEQRRVRVDVTERTPERAEALAAALRAALGPTGRGAFRAEAAARRRFVRSRLKSPLTTPAERRRLAERARALPAFFGGRSTRLRVGPPPARPRPTRLIDRAVDALPGRYPPAPTPLGAGSAGLLASLALAAVAAAAGLIRLPLPLRRRALAAGPPPRRPRTARRRSPP